MSYIDQVYSFDDRKAILEYLGKAIRYEGLSTKSDLCCDDLIDNICIILRDGEKFAFLHRSFQEYFSALFLSTRDFDAFFPCVDQIAKRDYDTMSVLVFLAEMNRDLFERRYAGPKIRELAKETRTNNYKKFLGLFFTSLTYRADRKRFVTSILMTGGPPYFYLFNKLRIIYNAVQFPNPELEEVRESLEISGDKDVEYDIVDMSEHEYNTLGLEKYINEFRHSIHSFLERISKEESERKVLLSDSFLKNKKHGASQRTTKSQA